MPSAPPSSKDRLCGAAAPACISATSMSERERRRSGGPAVEGETGAQPSVRREGLNSSPGRLRLPFVGRMKTRRACASLMWGRKTTAHAPPPHSGLFGHDDQIRDHVQRRCSTDFAATSLPIEPLVLGFERLAAAAGYTEWSAVMNARVVAPSRRYGRKSEPSRDGHIRRRQDIELFGLTVWIFVIVALLTVTSP
jgi:hypothetical protein